MLDPKVWWPLFPLLLLVVVVCLTWGVVASVRRQAGRRAIWLQAGAFLCYIAAAVAAISSERGHASVNLHRPFSLLAQIFLFSALIYYWKGANRGMLWVNGIAWGAILADTALHYLMTK